MATPSKVKLPPQLVAVEVMLLWHNVPKAAAVLGTATVLYILLEWSGVPLLAWLSTVTIVTIMGCIIWAFGARFAGISGPAEHLPSIFRTGLDEAAVRQLAEKTRVMANDGLAVVARLLSGNDPVLGVKAIAILWIVGTIGRYITPIGLLYTVILGLFTLPKLYEMRKDDIDGAVGKARVAAQQHYKTGRAKATELINRLTPQKGARPAASDISKSE